MRQTLMGVVAVVLIGAAVATYVLMQPPPIEPDHIYLNGVCLACQKPVTATYKPGGGPPLVCPECGQQAVYQWCYCQDCEKRFVPRMSPTADGSPPRPPIVPACAQCGGVRTGTWDDALYESKGDVPLPPWPSK